MRTGEFTSDAEIAELVAGFEKATLPASDFTHLAHVAVALSYIDQMPAEKALARMREKIRNFARHHGADRLYHETLTVFWMRLLRHLSTVYNVDLPLWQRVNLISARWATPLPVAAHYSPHLINSEAAREGWIPPDLLPLPF
jgi:hypothetical protein